MIRGFSLYAVIYIIVIQLLQLVTSPVWRLMLATISLLWTYTVVQFITQSTPFTVDIVGTPTDLATVHFIWVSVVIVYHYICYSVSNSYWARSMYAVTIKPMCSMINAVLYLIRNLRAIVCLPENITFLSTRNRATMPSLGKIEEFNSATTSINRYLERLEQYFVANSVPADSAESHKWRAILISVIGAKAYDVRSDLCSLTPPSVKMYAQLTTILTNHFAPKKLVIAERYWFHNCTQHKGESVTAFAANLKHLASALLASSALTWKKLYAIVWSVAFAVRRHKRNC